MVMLKFDVNCPHPLNHNFCIFLSLNYGLTCVDFRTILTLKSFLETKCRYSLIIYNLLVSFVYIDIFCMCIIFFIPHKYIFYLKVNAFDGTGFLINE